MKWSIVVTTRSGLKVRLPLVIPRLPPLIDLDKVPKPEPLPWREVQIDGRTLPAIQELATLSAIESIAQDLSAELKTRIGETIAHARRHLASQLPDGIDLVEDDTPHRSS